MKKKLLLIALIAGAIFSTSSCGKEESGDEQMKCGGDSCLIKECTKHPSGEWVYEHCYDYILNSNLAGTDNYKQFYRDTYQVMNTRKNSYSVFFKVNLVIQREYDIWNRKK